MRIMDSRIQSKLKLDLADVQEINSQEINEYFLNQEKQQYNNQMKSTYSPKM